MVVGGNVQMSNQKKNSKLDAATTFRICYVFWEILSCSKLNLFMMKNVATMKRWKLDLSLVMVSWQNSWNGTTFLCEDEHNSAKGPLTVHENKLFMRLYNCNGRNCRLVWHGCGCNGWYHRNKRCTPQINREWKGQSERMLNRKSRQDKIEIFYCFSRCYSGATALNKEFENQCVLASSSNGWMNEELVLKFLRQFLGIFSFKKRLLSSSVFWFNRD